MTGIYLKLPRSTIENILLCWFVSFGHSKWVPTQIHTYKLQTYSQFLLEVWEALYRYFLSIFLYKEEAPPDFLECAANWILSLPQSTDQSSAQRNVVEMFADLSDKYDYQSEFSTFMNIHMKKEETFKFWGQFVLQDCSAYVALYLAIRSGNWKLRMAAIKSMAALFTAFDRQKYQKLIPQHIVDLLIIPSDVLSNLESGGFTVSL